MITCRRSSLVAVGALLALAACRQTPEGSTPVIEEPAVSFLATELSRTLDRVEEARLRVRSDPDRATELLDATAEGLQGLREFHVPLLEARARAYNAYRYHAMDRGADAERELERIETAVLDISRNAEGTAVAELERIAGLVAAARVEIGGASPGAASALRALVTALDDVAAKGDLFL